MNLTMDVLLGWIFNIFELTIFRTNTKQLFSCPDKQIKKEKKGRDKEIK